MQNITIIYLLTKIILDKRIRFLYCVRRKGRDSVNDNNQYDRGKSTLRSHPNHTRQIILEPIQGRCTRLAVNYRNTCGHNINGRWRSPGLSIFFFDFLTFKFQTNNILIRTHIEVCNPL